jgi:hypothetical protein
MRARDLAIVGAVLLLGGFALADGLRGKPSEESAPPPPPPATDTVPVPEVRVTQKGIRRAFGALVYTDLKGRDCRLREYLISSGVSLEPPPITTNCQVWAPLKTSRIAYGVPTMPSEASTSFRFIDLNHPRRPLGGRFESSTHTVIWKSDGQRAAWCDAAGDGIDYNLDAGIHAIGGCPVAYTPSGQAAYVDDGFQLVAGKRVVYPGPGSVHDAHWGEDGSLALLLDLKRVVRTAADGTRTTTPLDVLAVGRRLTFSPDNCAAFWAGGETIHILDLGCFQAGNLDFPGVTAAWSPDGRWIAIAQPTKIVFQHLIGGDESGSWPVRAGGLAWIR